jgi:hypothetical protein
MQAQRAQRAQRLYHAFMKMYLLTTTTAVSEDTTKSVVSYALVLA